MRDQRLSGGSALRTLALAALVVTAIALLVSGMPEAQGQVSVSVSPASAPTSVGGVSVTLVTQAELAAAMSVPQPSARELEALYLQKIRRQELPSPLATDGGTTGSSQALPPETEIQSGDDVGQVHGNPATFVVGRNNRNTPNPNGALGSSLAEPAAANNGAVVFAAGNLRHAERSFNGGVAWANIPLPGGPADAPIFCCDNDVVLDDARRALFHSALYFNSIASDGVVRLFVWRRITDAAFACSYDIRVNNGADTTVVPDFPHLGLTEKHLFLSINGVGSSTNIVRYMLRLPIDQLIDCVAPTLQFFSQFAGTLDVQRAWFPAQGTNNHESMYWTQLDPATCPRLTAACTTMHIFRWRDALAAPDAVAVRAIAASRHNVTPDCRGGVGNFNMVTGIGTDARGFSMRSAFAPAALADGRGVLGVWWNSAPTGGILQGHIRAAIFESSSLALITQPAIFNQSLCIVQPNVTSNKRGDFGMSLAWGGKAGGLGLAANGAVGMDDEFTAGLGVFSLATVITGTHNRSDGRYGDYTTVRPHEPCEKWFVATAYALRDGVGVGNVNSRWVEYGRNVSLPCWRNGAFVSPTP